VQAYTLTGSTHLQKLGFAYSVPSLPPSNAIAPQAHVFVALIDDQPFANSNPTVVYQQNTHTPNLLPAPDPSNTALINPPTSPFLPLSPGLYPVITFEIKNDTKMITDVPLSPSTSPTAALSELAAHPAFYPVLASVLALATLGLYLGARSWKKRRNRRSRNRKNNNNIPTTLPPQPTPPSVNQPPPQKIKEEKKKVEPESSQVVTEENKVEGGETGGDAGGNGSDGNNPNNNNTNNTPSKRKTPNKRKPKPAPIIYTKTKAKKKDTKISDGEGEGEGATAEEKGEVQEVEKVPKSVRVITENGVTKIGNLEITQNILGIFFIYKKKKKKYELISYLGYGSGGTIVFEGFLHGRRVAVKRMLAQFMDLARQEISSPHIYFSPLLFWHFSVILRIYRFLYTPTSIPMLLDTMLRYQYYSFIYLYSCIYISAGRGRRVRVLGPFLLPPYITQHNRTQPQFSRKLRIQKKAKRTISYFGSGHHANFTRTRSWRGPLTHA
jgi:hypothetical protein